MTEYGRGPGSQPWHPDDPLYGERGRDEAQQQSGWDPYDGRPQPYRPQERQEQQYYQQYYQQQDPYPEQRHRHSQPYHYPEQHQYGGWHGGQDGTAQHYGVGADDPYGQQPPYDPGAQQPDYYATPDAYPSPRRRRQQPEPGPETGWDPGPDEGEHAFFADRGDDGGDDADDDSSGRGDRSRRDGAKRRSGWTGVIVALAVVGGVGTVGYYGPQFYKSRFADAPDFAGEGTGEIKVEIPEGSSVSDMGNTLKREGVVKSHDAFLEASAANGNKAQFIHAGTYTLRKRMSADAALDLMLDPKSQTGLVIAEGLRATEIYELIDERTGSPEGSTEKAAGSADLPLPEWAGEEVEGLLFPSKYSVGEKRTPESVLKTMVKRATAEFTKVNLESEAEKIGRTPLEVLTIASLIQAEAKENEEFGKVSRVIHNRLKPDNTATNGKLEFDSTINYAMGYSTLDVSVNDTRFDSPYNTYLHAGLPPGPIDNPGHQAIEAALNPTEGDWLYFVTVKPGDTRFTTSIDEHNQHVAEFNEEQRKKRENNG
jgi:uncharacterized YceG family protein